MHCGAGLFLIYYFAAVRDDLCVACVNQVARLWGRPPGETASVCLGHIIATVALMKSSAWIKYMYTKCLCCHGTKSLTDTIPA